MSAQVANIIKAANFQLVNIGRAVKLLTTNATKLAVHTLITSTSRLNYCNSLLIGLNESLLKRLHNIQRTTARLVTRKCKYDPVTNQAAHWLQNSCSCFQIHSPPDTSIHIRHASRTVQCQTVTLQFIVFTTFCWTSHPCSTFADRSFFPAMVREFGINYRNISNVLDQ